MKHKKLLSVLGAAALCVPVMAGIAGCGCSAPANFQVNSKEVYATSAVASVKFLSTANNNGTVGVSSLLGTGEVTRPEGIKNDIEDLAKCLSMFDQILSNEKIGQQVEKNDKTDVESKYNKYSVKMTITLPKVSGTGSDVFAMYYNETGTETDKEVTDEKEEIEINTTLEGVMVLNETEYPVTGEKTVESEENENETSISFTTFTNDYKNKISVEQTVELEDGEKSVEYEYTISQGTLKSAPKVTTNSADDYNYKEIFSTEVEIEQEKGKNEIEFQFVDLTTHKPVEKIYELTQNADKSYEIKVYNSKTMEEDTELKIKAIAKGNGEYEFEYSNNTKEIVNAELPVEKA